MHRKNGLPKDSFSQTHSQTTSLSRPIAALAALTVLGPARHDTRLSLHRLLLSCLLLGALIVSTCQPIVAHGQTTVMADKGSPLYQSKGDQKRSYKFPGTDETIPYRIYVPSTWKPGSKMPLVVILHGGGLDENAPFDNAPDNLKGILVAEAEKHGFVVAAPNGYHKEAMWGSPFGYGVGPNNAAPTVRTTPEEMARINPRGEQDALNVLELMTQEYGIDRSRVFIMGNSRGSMGTLYMVEKHPELWLAMAPSDGPIAEVDTYPYDQLKIKGAVFVHGDKDIVPIELNRRIAQHVTEQGITTEFIMVPDGEHGSSWYMALPQTFNFLASFPRSFPAAVPNKRPLPPMPKKPAAQ
jgi:poly(3-hydroxybutyrate) depolymerase